MTTILLTGACGFVGRALMRRLIDEGLDGRPVDRLVALDIAFDGEPASPRITRVEGSVADADARRAALADPPDVVFHLASVPGGAAERDYALGRRANLDATLGLLEDLRGDARPRLVFASSVAVYGDLSAEPVGPATPANPALTYGAHKLVGEVLVADATRRGWLEGCSLRIPGVVARPGSGDGLISAYMSRLFHGLAAGEPVTVPVSPQGKSWWISAAACVDNLVHAATVPVDRLPARRCVQMPALWLSVAEVVDALAERFGAGCRDLVRYQPDPRIDRQFAAYPDLDTREAEAAGFRHDGTPARLVERALQA